MSFNEEFIHLYSLIFGLSLSFVFFALGLLIYVYKFYNLIAGYNRSSEEEKKQYDIEELAKHVGQGLITLSVLLTLSTIFFFLELYLWFNIFIGLFIFIAFIIPIGALKFMPEQQRLIKEGSADAKHPFFRRVLPEKVYRSLERKTRLWLQVCSKCGHRTDFWEAGGVRGGGIGEPSTLQYCEKCKKFHMHKIRKKTFEELDLFPLD